MTTCTCDTFTAPVTVTTSTSATTLYLTNNGTGAASGRSLAVGSAGEIETFICTSAAASHYCMTVTNFSTGGCIKATASGNSTAINAISGGGYALDAQSTTGTCLNAHVGTGIAVNATCNSGTALNAYSLGGDGLYVEGTGRAIYAHHTGSSGYALVAQATGTNPAGYFTGNVSIVGTLSKSAGSFTIDHPLDLENKILQHSFVESPEMLNVYNGIVVCDDKGEAIVELPAYFEALNTSFRYHLTPIGGSAPNLYISSEVKDNKFSLSGATSKLKVSWTVTGVRQDAYALAHPIVVEVDKKDEEKGRYLTPLVHGKTMKDFIHPKAHEPTSSSKLETAEEEAKDLPVVLQG